MSKYDIERDMHYLLLLSKSFPNVASASTEIINLSAIMNLPKGTEHFLADIHGEHEAFIHVLKNASGRISKKVDDIFGEYLPAYAKKELCTLIYYPEQKLELIKSQTEDLEDWYRMTLHQLVKVFREISSKYTRSKVRKSLPDEYSYILEELLHERPEEANKVAYVNVIIDTIISTDSADDFITALANVIQRLAIDQLHILGDVYDRGPGAHIIMDKLGEYHSWDIQWGNHDILWMGACAGNIGCICNVIRLSLRYANLMTLEDGYGINLMPLATFAMETYGKDTCEAFKPILNSENKDKFDKKTLRLMTMMHKAISVLQFKAEAQIFKRNPSWQMEDRCMLSAIDFEKGVCRIDGKEYAMLDMNFPTVDPENPNAFTEEEELLMKKLVHSFRISEKLQRHIKTMLSHGCMYAVYNNNLLFHASIPLNEDGTLKEVEIMPGTKLSGHLLLKNTGMLVRSAFQNDTPKEEKEYAKDYFLYLWCGKDSCLFDKSKMATFERYFIVEKETHIEKKGVFFRMRDDDSVAEKMADTILDAFGVIGENRHIINGHVPVHVKKGETPIKANGKLMVIDGGFAEPYHKETGIAGYTLVYHSREFELVQHEPFTNVEDAVREGRDIKSTANIVAKTGHRLLVADTDLGQELNKQIADLRELLYAYRHGFIKEVK
ncbi:MAG: fructose-1,6-bisphosphatase [Prevotella sp.]|nr:fructose-1,6-bisphosphatase [Candidatus Prevotella equi]